MSSDEHVSPLENISPAIYDLPDAYTLLWVLVIVGGLGDIATTVLGLQIGLSEINPFVAAMLSRYGLIILPALKIVVFAWIMFVDRVLGRRYAIGALVGLGVPQGVAVLNNAITISGV